MSKPNFVRALVPYSFLSCSLSLDSVSSFSFVFLPNPWVLPPSSLVLPAFFPCSPSPSSFLPPYSFLLLTFFVLFFYNPSSQSFPPSLYLFYPSSVLLLPTFLLVPLSSCLLHPFLPPPSLPVLHLCCIVSSSHVFLLCSFVIVCVIVLCLGIIALCMSLQVVVLPFVYHLLWCSDIVKCQMVTVGSIHASNVFMCFFVVLLVLLLRAQCPCSGEFGV